MFEASFYHRGWMASHPELYGADVRERLFLGAKIPATAYADALARRQELIAAVETAMRDFDAILAPATAMVAPPVGGPDVREPLTRFTRPFSATGQPVVTLRAPIAGLPVGIQVVGHMAADLRLLEVALALEANWR
jgi:aspartyl-tRNA(Asn)/glutamyl-tRNA(Gln) amidotransferase subunit A